jgi:3-oxo-5alpha-steroid 4-dehydrogenase
VGETDSVQAMRDYLMHESGDIVKNETLLRFCEQSSGMIDWLMQHGVKFSGPVFKKKTSYPNINYFLYHSDNSLLPAYRGEHPPAARGHRAVISRGKSAVNLGGSIYWPMRDSALSRGVRLERLTEARQLIVDEDGSVLGVKALHLPHDSQASSDFRRYQGRAERLLKTYPAFLPGGKYVRRLCRKYFAKSAAIAGEFRVERYYRARKGVVLAGGGFIFNRKMVAEYCPKYLGGMPLGTRADDGSSIRLGQSAGGKTEYMHRATAWRFINPPYAWSQGMIVNQNGQRFVNESCYGATIGDAMVERNDGKAWLVLDGRLVKESWKQIMPGKLLPFQSQLAALNMLFSKQRYKSLDDLCESLTFDPATFLVTLENYRLRSRGEIEDPFQKATEDCASLEWPLHVINISLKQKLLPCPVLTMGGLAVNERTGEVINGAGEVIAGLYAAGRTAVGIPSNLYMSGLSIADGIFAGRRAGRHAADRA